MSPRYAGVLMRDPDTYYVYSSEQPQVSQSLAIIATGSGLILCELLNKRKEMFLRAGGGLHYAGTYDVTTVSKDERSIRAQLSADLRRKLTGVSSAVYPSPRLLTHLCSGSYTSLCGVFCRLSGGR